MTRQSATALVSLALLTAPALLGAQTTADLDERLGWRDWSLGSEVPAEIETRAELRDADPCYAWYHIPDAEDLYDAELGAVDLTYTAGILTSITIKAEFEAYEALLNATTEYYGYGDVLVGLPYDEDYGYHDDGEERMVEWRGREVGLVLARTPSEFGEPGSVSLTYDLLSPAVSYEQCSEREEPVVTVGEF